LALAWNAQSEWRDPNELRINLLFNRRIRAAPSEPLTTGTPIAAELWSYLPHEGRIILLAHQTISRVMFRLPDGVDETGLRVRRTSEATTSADEKPSVRNGFVQVSDVQRAEKLELSFPLKEYQTTQSVGGVTYHVRWKGSAVVGIEPKGKKVPLYADRENLTPIPICSSRYP
jgi:hypothetical protein